MQLLGGTSSSVGAAGLLGVIHDMNSSTPAKQKHLTRRRLLPDGIPSIGSPIKRDANVAFKVSESSEDFMRSF